MRRPRLSAVAAGAALLAAAVSGCSTEAGTVDRELTIFAAASLVAPFTELAEDFGRAHPEITVNPIVFDGSSTLATQILEGAPADVFASADETTMERVVDAVEGEPQTFAHNVLQIAVEPGNPLDIASLADLASPGLQFVACAPEVPCGAAAGTLLALDGVDAAPVSQEQNVKAVLTKVASGEADAGLVYTTDVMASAGAVDGVEIPGAERAVNTYRIASMRDAVDSLAAQAFMEYVLSDEGQALLASHGFAAP